MPKAAQPQSLPGVEQLETTPEILRCLMSHLTEEEANWKPAPDRFSIAEVLEHLSHTEGHCFRLRAERTVNEDRPQWEPYDTQAYIAAAQYAGRSAEDSFDHFEEQREDNLEYLKNLPAPAGERIAVHPKLGPITLAELMNEWAFHDLGHIRQVAEIVRALRYYPNMGAFRSQYTVHP